MYSANRIRRGHHSPSAETELIRGGVICVDRESAIVTSLTLDVGRQWAIMKESHDVCCQN